MAAPARPVLLLLVTIAAWFLFMMTAFAWSTFRVVYVYECDLNATDIGDIENRTVTIGAVASATDGFGVWDEPTRQFNSIDFDDTGENISTRDIDMRSYIRCLLYHSDHVPVPADAWLRLGRVVSITGNVYGLIYIIVLLVYNVTRNQAAATAALTTSGARTTHETAPNSNALAARYHFLSKMLTRGSIGMLICCILLFVSLRLSSVCTATTTNERIFETTEQRLISTSCHLNLSNDLAGAWYLVASTALSVVIILAAAAVPGLPPKGAVPATQLQPRRGGEAANRNVTSSTNMITGPDGQDMKQTLHVTRQSDGSTITKENLERVLRDDEDDGDDSSLLVLHSIVAETVTKPNGSYTKTTNHYYSERGGGNRIVQQERIMTVFESSIKALTDLKPHHQAELSKRANPSSETPCRCATLVDTVRQEDGSQLQTTTQLQRLGPAAATAIKSDAGCSIVDPVRVERTIVVSDQVQIKSIPLQAERPGL